MSRHGWLLLIHVAGAFSDLARVLLAVVLNLIAIVVLMIWKPKPGS